MKNQYGIADVMQLLGLPVEPPRAGRNEVDMTCPFCGYKKKMAVDYHKNYFHCYKCGEGGGKFDLYMKLRGMPTWQEAREEIEERLFGPRQDKPYRCLVIKTAPASQYRPAPIGRRDTAYRALLNILRLSQTHHDDLRARGLSDAAIESGLYRSIPFKGFDALGNMLTDAGVDLSHVPGFLKRSAGNYAFTNAYGSGILIPVRDFYGRIQGMQVRYDRPPKGRKYQWLSTVGKPEGGEAHGWVHLVGKPQKRIFLTEGALKANVIHALSHFTLIALQGVNSQKYLEKTLDFLKSRGVEQIVGVFDMDMFEKPEVLSAFLSMDAAVRARHLQLQHLTWDKAYKGFDDYLLACRQKKAAFHPTGWTDIFALLRTNGVIDFLETRYATLPADEKRRWQASYEKLVARGLLAARQAE